MPARPGEGGFVHLKVVKMTRFPREGADGPGQRWVGDLQRDGMCLVRHGPLLGRGSSLGCKARG